MNYCFSSATMVARTYAILGYTYIACLAFLRLVTANEISLSKVHLFKTCPTKHVVMCGLTPLSTRVVEVPWRTVGAQSTRWYYKLPFSLKADVRDLQNKNNWITMTRTCVCVQLMCLMYVASCLQHCTTSCY